MDTKPVERKYALRKIQAGDWLLYGNDGKTVWRLCRYEDFTAWQVWRWPKTAQPSTVEDIDDRDRWDLWEQGLESRDDAIQSALRSELPRPKPEGKESLQEAIRSMAAQT